MALIVERSMQCLINQVPLIVQNVFLGMGGVMNVALLKLKDPTSIQPAVMLTKGNQTPQGSRSSTRAESTGVEITSLPYSILPNPDKASSFAPPKSAAGFEPMAMDVPLIPL
jgi:hypothetical protein